ncbi:zinc finger and SCAN domain-containing protein 29-like isoform X2 [Temnothorax longispinosus]|uniref:zinc finger and SCAN domain-containing protein 29-like isoform X2 n=1 Tax=Temnothorax longispinosus TaxID=300112 RepID=UPI003A991007
MSCKKGLNWGEEETRTFLELCTDRQIIALMDGKKHKHVDIFNLLVEDMEKKGFSKTAQQMKLKLKNLKLAYYKCKRENNVSGAAKKTCPFYEQLDILYSTRPNVQVLNDSSGIDTANVQNESSCEYTEDCSTINDSDIPEESESSSTISNEPPRKKKRGLLSDKRRKYHWVKPNK